MFIPDRTRPVVVKISENQTSGGQLSSTEHDTLQELVQRLAPIAGAMSNTGQLRVVVPSTSTVTGPITSAQSIAEKAIGGASYTQRVAQENLTATIANVNNCTGV